MPSIDMAKSRDDPYEHWLKLFNKASGYAGQFNYSTNATDKIIVEMSVAREWRDAVNEEYEIELGEPKHNPRDPPDCYISLGSKTLSVELVQLVHSQHKLRASKGESPYQGRLFEDMQWTSDRMISELNSLIWTKGSKYAKNHVTIDVLVIFTDEPWLSHAQTNLWLSNVRVEAHPQIKSAFLLLSYAPGRNTDCWPVHKLYGGDDLGLVES